MTINSKIDIADFLLNYWNWSWYCQNSFELLILNSILYKLFLAIEVEVDIEEILLSYWNWSWYCRNFSGLLILKLILHKTISPIDIAVDVEVTFSTLVWAYNSKIQVFFTMLIRLRFCNKLKKILKYCNTIGWYWYRYWSWYCTNFFRDIEIEVAIAEPFLSYWNWSWCCIYFCDLLILKLISKNLFRTIDIEVDIAKPNLNYWYWGWYRGIFLR